jgi:NADPH:quinone reductase-like Zn-dependent oxidoreductase
VLGVLCEFRIFKDSAVIQTPDYLSDDEACALGGAGTTAWMAVNGMRPLGQPGGTQSEGRKVVNIQVLISIHISLNKYKC